MAVGVNGSQSIPSKSTLSERKALELNDDERFRMLFIDILLVEAESAGTF